MRCYSRVSESAPAAPAPPGITAYHRSEAFTFLTLPEWFIVFSTDEYARFVRERSPSAFPFIASAAQYWQLYGAVCDATRDVYPFETGYHVMLGVIGLSQTLEYGVKGLYEGTVGRLTGWLFTRDTPEDRYAAAVAAEYGTFMHATPWYRFPFVARLRGLWTTVPLWGPHVLRKWERRAALSAELLFKGVYGWLMGLGSQAAYGAEDLTTYARVVAPATAVEKVGGRVIAGSPEASVVALPRYEAFTPASLQLLAGGARFLDVAGNDNMLITAIVRNGTAADLGDVPVVARQTLASDSRFTRTALAVPMARLGDVVRRIAASGATVEHLYDY
jgi:hypothetical protein